MLQSIPSVVASLNDLREIVDYIEAYNSRKTFFTSSQYLYVATANHLFSLLITW